MKQVICNTLNLVIDCVKQLARLKCAFDVTKLYSHCPVRFIVFITLPDSLHQSQFNGSDDPFPKIPFKFSFALTLDCVCVCLCVYLYLCMYVCVCVFVIVWECVCLYMILCAKITTFSSVSLNLRNGIEFSA